MSRKKEFEDVIAPDEATEDIDDDEKKGGSIDVLDSNDNLIRTYSSKVHGKGYNTLAKKFVDKFPKYHLK